MEALHHFPEPEDFPKICHGRPVVLLGSCFSTNLQASFRAAGFQTMANPFGTVFHPLPLARFVCESLAGTDHERLLLRDDIWLSEDAGSEVYALSNAVLREKLRLLRAEFAETLSRAELLIVTFGSSHGYRSIAGGEIVANCHKQPHGHFRKELADLPELVLPWEEVLALLRGRFPQLQVVFTVSPVRYSRDGWAESNRSKARLLLLTEALCDRANAFYFPSYELVNDVLRDYRYFSEDGVHPNQQAIDAVWNLFRRWSMDERTSGIVDELGELRRMEGHRLLFPESVKSEEFRRQLREKKEVFLGKHPEVCWEV